MMEIEGLVVEEASDGRLTYRPPTSERYSAKDAYIGWSTNKKGEISDVLVTGDQGLWSLQRRSYQNSGGKCYANWMRHLKVPTISPDDLFSPEGVFGSMLASGFATKSVLANALAQFAHLHEATWAGHMLLAMCCEISEQPVEAQA
jgi:hypothetical protein